MIQKKALVQQGRVLFKKQITYVWLLVILLLGMVIYQQCAIYELQEQLVADHDVYDTESVAWRLQNLEGRSNKHGDAIDELQKEVYRIRFYQSRQDWAITQLQWGNPQVPVIPPTPVKE